MTRTSPRNNNDSKSKSKPSLRVSSRAKNSTTPWSTSTTATSKQPIQTSVDTSRSTAMKKNKKGKQQSKQQRSKLRQIKQQTKQKNKPATSIRCPETDEVIQIATATLADIKLAKSLRRPPWLKSKQYFVTIPSPAVRQSIYDTAAAALVDLETRLLPTYGGRPWQCIVTVSDDHQYYYEVDDKVMNDGVQDGDNNTMTSGSEIKKSKRITIKKNAKSYSTPYFIWNSKGQLEIAALPNMIEKIPNPPRFPGFAALSNTNGNKKKKAATDKVKYDDKAVGEHEVEENEEEEELTEEEMKWREIQEREITPLSTLAYNERMNGVPLPHITVKWKSPLHEIFRKRTAAYEHAKTLCQQEVLIDKYLYGYSANGSKIMTPNILTKIPTRQITYKVGKIRFERDGIWIIGQEQSWQQQRLEDILQVEGKSCKIPEENDKHIVSATATNTKHNIKSLSSAMNPNKKGFEEKSDDDEIVMASGSITKGDNNAMKSGYVTPSPPPTYASSSHSNSDNDDDHHHGYDGIITATVSTTPLGGIRTVLFPSLDTLTKPPSASTKTTKESNIQQPNNSIVKSFTPNRAFCLNDKQVKLCYDAGLEHYDQIIRTVTARDLQQELQDGFDLLRERGKGRFDMELPIFDNDIQFSFLTDIKKSPWMPIVHQILGQDVVLIHKGIFISMPGSGKQDYHQDGLHLTRSYQKPCHAINVFIPLVDLTTRQIGPTEFCLGSHILGNEAFREEFLLAPEVQAGCPIIFDYRLGHRGLANTSKVCRPIVYCTYAPAAGNHTKEFRDSINFSRKRYHKIGDLVSKAPNRMERAQKRQRIIDENILEQTIQQSKLVK